MGSIFPNDEAHKRLMESGKELQKSIDAGIKHDAGKPSLSLIDRTALVELARVLDFGAKKYAAHNWRGGIKWSRILDSAMRHLQAFNDGEDLDPETGLSHVAHAMCNCMFLLNYIQNHKELDDRYKKELPPNADPSWNRNIGCVLPYSSPELIAVAEANTQLSPSTVRKINNPVRVYTNYSR